MNWDELLAFAVIRFGLKIKEFWRLLPREFVAITEEYNKWAKEEYDLTVIKEDLADWRMGVLASIMANTHRTKGRTFKPSDFIPQKKVKKDMTTEQMLNEARKITALMGGEIKK